MLYPGRLLALLIPFFLLGLAFAAEERHPSPTTQIDILGDFSSYVSPQQSLHKESRLSWRLTNAERLRLGLPLKRPSFVKRTLTPVPSPVLRRAYIQVVGSDGNTVGYISKSSPSLALVTDDITCALIVQFNAVTSSPYNFLLQNSDSGTFQQYPNLIASTTSDDKTLMPGSWNQFVLAAGHETPLNSPPISGTTSWPASGTAYESAIFVVSASQDLTIQWVNPDGSKPSAYFMYIPQSTAITITGDVSAYQNYYGSGRVPVSMKLVIAP